MALTNFVDYQTRVVAAWLNAIDVLHQTVFGGAATKAAARAALTSDAPFTVAQGGTNATTAAGARTSLGVVIGTDVQAYDAGLQSIAGLTTAADKMVYTTASDVYATTDLTAAGRALLDDASAAAQRTTLSVPATTLTLTAAGLVTGGGDLSANRTFTVTAATQSDMETATSTTTAVTPAVQHNHPGHPKCWAFVTVSAGTPTLSTSYNITSITDTATGRLTITIGTDFSSANWCAMVGTESATTVQRASAVSDTTRAAGSVEIYSVNSANNLLDPTSWSFIGMGDQ
jgi:hypothetical protein